MKINFDRIYFYNSSILTKQISKLCFIQLQGYVALLSGLTAIITVIIINYISYKGCMIIIDINPYKKQDQIL